MILDLMKATNMQRQQPEDPKRKTAKDYEIPIPKRKDFFQMLKNVAETVTA
jgi:hypothetical protein